MKKETIIVILITLFLVSCIDRYYKLKLSSDENHPISNDTLLVSSELGSFKISATSMIPQKGSDNISLILRTYPKQKLKWSLSNVLLVDSVGLEIHPKIYINDVLTTDDSLTLDSDSEHIINILFLTELGAGMLFPMRVYLGYFYVIQEKKTLEIGWINIHEAK